MNKMAKKEDKPTNVIQWANPGPDDIVWKYEADNIRTISALVVREHEVAAFYRDGQIFDVMGPGKHTLTSGNIPLLTKAYQKILGYGESPFKAEVVFVSTKMFNGKWGVRAMVKVDKDYEAPIPLMANGDYQFRIDDATLFLTQVIGGQKVFNTDAVSKFMKSFISEQITQELSKQYYMDVYTNLDKASTTTKVHIADYFTQRGIELLALKIGGVQTEEKYQQDIYNFQRFRTNAGRDYKQFEVMERMADAIGDSSGGAAMGTGMLLFPQMYQNLQQQQQQNTIPQQGQQQQSPKAVCQYCGVLNDYPYKFCRECGKPPVAAAKEEPAPSTGASNASAGGNKGFSRCPYCGETLNLPKPPKFCPYCSEQLQ